MKDLDKEFNEEEKKLKERHEALDYVRELLNDDYEFKFTDEEILNAMTKVANKESK